MSEGIDSLPHMGLVPLVYSIYYRYIMSNELEHLARLSSVISYKFSDSILAITKRGDFLIELYLNYFTIDFDCKARTHFSNNLNVMSLKCITESLPQLLSSLLL